MSIYPCFFCERRVPGRLSAAYPSILDGASRMSGRLRLCDPHVDHLFEAYGSGWVRADAEGESTSFGVCCACGQATIEPSALRAFFLTVYRRGSEREDWFAEYCPGCAAELIKQLGLEPDSRQPAA